MKNRVFLSLYLVIRYFTIMLLVFFIVGTFKLENYGIWMIIYFVAINYLAIRYGMVYEIDKKGYLKNELYKSLVIFILIFNIGIYIIYNFKLIEIILLSVVPVIELKFIKTKEEKQKTIEQNTKKAIDEYFNNKK